MIAVTVRSAHLCKPIKPIIPIRHLALIFIISVDLMMNLNRLFIIVCLRV